MLGVSEDQDQQQKLLRATLADMLAVRLEELVNTAQRIRRSTQSKTLSRQNLAQLSIVGAFLAMVALIVLNLYLMKRSILQPLRALAAAGVTRDADNVQRYDNMAQTKTGGLTETFQMLVERIQAVQESLRMETTERAHAQEALQRLNEEMEMRVLDRTAELTKANQKLQALMDSLPVGVSFLDESCQRITGNSYFFAQFEITPDDNISGFSATTTTLSRFARFLRNGRDVGDTELPLQRAVAEKRVIPPIELDVHLPGGRRWIAEASGAPILDEQGNVLGGVAVTVDITDRKSAEQALKVSEERLRLAQTSANVGIWEWHVPSGKVYWTEELEKIYGYAKGTFPGTYEGFSHGVHPDDLAQYERLRDQAISKFKPFDVDFRINLPSGETRWINCKGSAHYDSTGSPERVFGVNVDITERKLMEQALADSEETFRSIFETSAQGILITVPDGRVLRANRTAQEILGMSEHEILSAARDGITDLSDPRLPLALEERKRTGRFSGELNYKRKDGTIFPVYLSSNMFSNTKGEVFSGIIFQDITEKKQAEQALRDSEERLLIAKTAARLGIHDYDILSDTIEWDERIRELWGVDPDVQITFDIFESGLHPDDRPKVRTALEKAFDHENDSYFNTDYRVINQKDGTMYWVTATGKVFFHEGRAVRLVGTVEDISERKQNEKRIQELNEELELRVQERTAELTREIEQRKRTEISLIESEQRFRSVFNNSIDAAFLVRPSDGKVFLANPAASKMFGLSEEEICEGGRGILVDLDDPRVPAFLEERNRKGKAVGEMNCKRSDGTTFPVEISGSIFTDVNGDERSILIVRDITERKQAEESVAANLEAMSRLQRIGALYIGESDLQRVLEEIVEAAIALTSADKGNIQIIDTQSNCLKIVAHRGFDQPFLDFWNRVYEGQGSCHNALETGQRVIVEDITKSPIFVDTPALQAQLAAGVRAVQSTPLIGRSGKVLGMISTHFNSPHWPDKRTLTLLDILVRQTTDIIERAEYEAELKEAVRNLTRSNQDLEHFAYVASHDLQEPLRTVTSSLQMFEKRNKGQFDKNSDQLIDYAVDGAKRMKALVQDLLAYSRVTSQGQSFKAVDMNEILDQSIVNCRSLIKAKGTSITYDKMPTVTADPTQLTQLLQNLVGNAVKFSPEQSGKVHVSAQQNGNEWIFSVKDNGIGIEEKYFEKIFVIFQQLSKKGPFHGTGIGLAIVKKIVERHGGRVWVESEVGKGSTFYFTIPNGTES